VRIFLLTIRGWLIQLLRAGLLRPKLLPTFDESDGCVDERFGAPAFLFSGSLPRDARRAANPFGKAMRPQADAAGQAVVLDIPADLVRVDRYELTLIGVNNGMAEASATTISASSRS